MIANQIDDSGPICAQCGYELEWEDCDACGGAGGWDMYEDDPIQHYPGEWDACDVCSGRGGWYFCPTKACPVVREGG